MKRIIIIDDELQVRDMLTKILERYGYEALAAENGKRGLEICKTGHADLVVTDLTMPEKDGMETIKELQQQYPETKIVAMSGGSDRFPDHFLQKAIEGGAIKTLKKPFRKDDIMKIVFELIGEGDKPGTGAD